MEGMSFLDLFQGIATLAAAEPQILIARIVLIFLGFVLIYLGHKGVLEALLMIPMGLGMATINAGVMFFYNTYDPATALPTTETLPGTLFVAPLAQETNALINILQIDWLQPIYTYMFSNGLIACLVFMGIGVLLDVGYVMQRPFQSMFLALWGELGSILVFPIAVAFGLSQKEAASVAIIGGADGPMVLFTSLTLARHLFVPITVVAYLYLGLTYGGYPYLIKALVPKRLRMLPTEPPKKPLRTISPGGKMVFGAVLCVVLSLLFPVAAPLFLSLFVGVLVRESGLTAFIDLIGGPILYGATFFLGLLLGVLCEAGTILSPVVIKLLLLGMLALLISGIGGLIGGYCLYFASGGKYNPVIGIAAVSCVPTTAKVAQKEVSAVAPGVIVLPQALGANISGVITTAIIAAIYVSVLRGLS